eukprot:GFUD01135444.1.p1 GENE.GFUD01135444.1~~GFUD01135444.1.p1  ORF type:complete len:437 (+),score=64.33 GFUD01135444.1:62-1372(+)
MADLAEPYVILLGDVGSGKSTVVEKLTGKTGRSSAANTSVTRTSEVFGVSEGGLVICDTPGSNAMEDQFTHNINIAHAMNFMPVNCVLIVVKGDVRMDTVVGKVKEYASVFLPEDLPIEMIGVCITHMDQVTWKNDELMHHLKTKLEIKTAIFSSLTTPWATLKADILAECKGKKAEKLDIDGELFLRLFKMSDTGLKVLRQVGKEVSRFETLKQDFYSQKILYDVNDQRDMSFEFQAWMSAEIIEAQKRLSTKNNFDFAGPQMASQAGHIANMTNQLRCVLRDVRISLMGYHKDMDTDFRKCPHCSAIWQKVEGCDGNTECGNRPTVLFDRWSGGVMASFRFRWDATAEKLKIEKMEEKKQDFFMPKKVEGRGGGCGKTINWAEMTPVTVGKDFQAADPCSTKDITSIPNEIKPSWDASFSRAMGSLNPLQIKRN